MDVNLISLRGIHAIYVSYRGLSSMAGKCILAYIVKHCDVSYSVVRI